MESGTGFLVPPEVNKAPTSINVCCHFVIMSTISSVVFSFESSIRKTLCRKIPFIMGIGNGIAMPGGFVNTGQLGQTLGMGAMMGITETGWTLGMIV